MNKDSIMNLALILLLSITAYSMVRYVSELKTRFRLQESLAQAQGEVVVLTQEKQNLLQELGKEKELNGQLAANNVNLKVYLKASKDRMTRLFRDNSKTKDGLEEINAKFAILKAENRVLIDSHKRSYIENEQFKLKLSSVVELKKAIRELRAKKSKAPGLETEGNQGFLIRDGRSTLGKIKIKVIPASYKSLRDYAGPAKTKE
jgi:DNA repair exonuclease SbcCD nuclease subunit